MGSCTKPLIFEDLTLESVAAPDDENEECFVLSVEKRGIRD